MANNFYNHGSFPTTGSSATSASMRSELDSIASGFDKLPALTGNGNKIVVVNGAGTALTQIANLPATSGGTGYASYTIGDLLYADTTTTLAKLVDVATGNALISGGAGAAPSWGKIGLTTHVSGTLPAGNGGTGITSLGTGVATALGVNVGSAGAFVVNGGALGTPSSGTVTNLTGTASININGTVGATTSAAGTFTNLIVNTSGVISVNTSGDALRITQLGTGNALVVEDDTNPDSTPFLVDATGLTRIGTNAALGSGLNFQLQIGGTSAQDPGIGIAKFATTGNPVLALARSRNTTATLGAIVQNNDVLGLIDFRGDDGSAWRLGARILAEVDGTPGTNDMPGRLVFSTTADGAATSTERFRISSDGRLQINGSNTLTSTLVGTGNSFPLSLASTAYQFRAEATFDAANTNAVGFGSTYGLPATGTFSSSYQFYAGGLPTAGAAVTNNFGLYIAGQTVGTNIYGVYSNIDTGTNRYNFYANGTADNYFAGNVGIGTAAPLAALNVNGAGGELIRISVTADGATLQEPALGFATGVTNTNPAAKISALEFDASDSRASLLFYTRGTNSDIAPTERLRITSSGGISFGSSGTAYGTAGQALISAGDATPVWTDQFLSITYVFSGIGAGDQGDLTIPFNCTITEWTLLADVSGSVVIDIWEDTYANYPPTVADTITGSAKPTISASTKGQSSTLTGWSPTIAAGSTLRFNVDSASTVNRVTLSLKVVRT